MHRNRTKETDLVQDEGLVGAQITATAKPDGAEGEEAPAFRYGRLFCRSETDAPTIESLVELGEAMATEDTLTRSRDDSRIPAGYTYLSHILAHELTFDRTEGLPSGPMDLKELRNGRSPFIDLGSIYGQGPLSTDHSLYEPDGVRLKVGPVKGPNGTKWNDLPRRSDGSAIVADERNDENLTTAQTLVALLKFHNKVADFLDHSRPGGKATFEEVRACVLQHFQSIILHDLVWRLVPDATYSDVLENGRKIFYPDGLKNGELPTLPIEFALAAFRFGHSMVRSSYRWSKHRQNISLSQLFEQTGRNSNRRFRALGEDWIIDWRNFYDFSAIEGCERRKEINFSRKIDTRMTCHLGRLPAGERRHGEAPNLAVRDLLRGRCLNLPSGQQVAEACYREHGVFVGCLGSNEFAGLQDRSTREILRKHSLHDCTPLWFYVLAEAEIEQNGECLGRLGGRILMEVCHGLLEFSEHSILADKAWRPMLPAKRSDSFSMPDLLHFVGDSGGA